MACSTGKTFPSLKIAERVVGPGKAVLFLAPSIALLNDLIERVVRVSVETAKIVKGLPELGVD